MRQLEDLMKAEFSDFYNEARKAKLSMPEVVIYVLGKAMSKNG
jgi:hypothetical protein